MNGLFPTPYLITHVSNFDARNKELRKIFVSKDVQYLNMYACICVFRFFPTVESYQSHIQLHQTSLIVSQTPSSESIHNTPEIVTKIAERSREIKRDEQYYENMKALKCPTCGKV